MKTKNILYILAVICLTVLIPGCEIAPDPGFDGQIYGSVKDSNGNPVYSDILANTIIVNALGEGDVSPIVIRVNGQGTFAYTKLFPKKQKVWITGPIYTSVGDTIDVDFSGGQSITQDFVVEPYISLDLALKSEPVDSTVTVTYTLTGNRGKVISARQIYCSTAPFPTSRTSSGPYYATFTKSVTSNTGETKFTGLKWGTRYYIRMGANGKTGSVNDLMNYSQQIIINIPGKTKK
jgi:hypothetical protein